MIQNTRKFWKYVSMVLTEDCGSWTNGCIEFVTRIFQSLLIPCKDAYQIELNSSDFLTLSIWEDCFWLYYYYLISVFSHLVKIS